MYKLSIASILRKENRSGKVAFRRLPLKSRQYLCQPQPNGNRFCNGSYGS